MKHNTLMRYLLVAAGALVAGLLVAGESWQAALPLIVLLACPLMMVFMMRTMRGHGGGPDVHNHDAAQTRPPRPAGHDRKHRDQADAGREL